jgi:hypothetical protein
MAIVLKENGISSDRAKDLMDFATGRLIELTHPASDIIALQKFCVTDKEFCYATFQFGAVMGKMFTDYTYARMSIFGKIRWLLGF